MKRILFASMAAAVLALPGAAVGQGNRDNAPGHDRVCLITWPTAADAATGADATALDGKYLPRRAAEAQAAQSGGRSRVFNVSVNTLTGEPRTAEEQRAFCEGPTFNPELRD